MNDDGLSGRLCWRANCCACPLDKGRTSENELRGNDLTRVQGRLLCANPAHFNLEFTLYNRKTEEL